MREIFKAKRNDNGEWVEGFLFQLYTDGGFSWCIGNEPLFPNDYSELCGLNRDWFYIDINTVCRYIGATDKNCNRIWENDIVFDGDNKENYMVSWSESELCYVVRGLNEDGSPFDRNYCCSTIEVIGNIFDNPELLGA